MIELKCIIEYSIDMKIKAIGFDLGNTLIYSEQSLNWSNNYKNALEKGFYSIKKMPTECDYNNCITILSKYNTRINPRENEVGSDQIFSEIMEILKLDLSEKELFENEFFRYFLQGNKLFDDTEEVLEDIKKQNLKTGILTDVPYGRVNGFVAEEIKPINRNIDIILSSVDIGYRKPNINGYIMLAKKLETKTNEMVYVGDEEKDIIGANNAGIISILINRTDKKINYGEKYQFKNLREMWYNLRRQTFT
ncbi:MAG: HAD family hydrolase [Treponema sp.]|jgi:putative hydrolase of the HAD superfamily|nr:HAD family hydrolase [Treponema sp.]